MNEIILFDIETQMNPKDYKDFLGTLTSSAKEFWWILIVVMVISEIILWRGTNLSFISGAISFLLGFAVARVIVHYKVKRNNEVFSKMMLNRFNLL